MFERFDLPGMVWLVVLSALLALASQPASAQMYKWKDEKGKWHFSDRPPPDQKDVETVGGGSGKKKSRAPITDDLAEALEKKIVPKTPVERATMAVVSIDTNLGGGSGFFVSDDGYLITNRHVVRPTTSTGFKEAVDHVEELKVVYEDAKERLSREKKMLDEFAAELADYRKQIDAESSSNARAEMEAEYKYYKEQYDRRKKNYVTIKKDYDKSRREFESAKSDFNRKSSAATLATNFRITLKDETTLTARLVNISKRYDLALLKLDGYVTPKSAIGDLGALAQGARVYAIGSPLGLDDSVTSGVVSGVRPEEVSTDAQILPGNSGGPLVTEEGAVVGVNTKKFAQTASSQGFGIAIRIDVAFREFSKELGDGS